MGLHDYAIEFQSTPLMRGETACGVMPPFLRIISIHSPHARGDCSPRPPAKTTTTFQSTPLMRGETCYIGDDGQTVIFQSTPLMRGETRLSTAQKRLPNNFNPLPSCEGRPRCRMARPSASNFNPLPSCEGRLQGDAAERTLVLFQSTPLMRGETGEAPNTTTLCRFQSTPLMRGETQGRSGQAQGEGHFNPLPSCEGRPL